MLYSALSPFRVGSQGEKIDVEKRRRREREREGKVVLAGFEVLGGWKVN